MPSERVIKTDVLVIGGGMAGFFAAIKAKEQGIDVTVVDKAYVGKAGSTHFSEGDILYFRPEKGHKLKEWVDLISQRCEYINNKEWDEICLIESEERYNDLVSWGIPFMEKDGETHVFTMMNRPSVYKDVTMVNRKYAPTLRQKALEIGIRVIDRIMICELLKQDEQIVGAIGFNTTSGNLYLFKTKAVVISTGSSSLKAGSYPVHFWTGDGEAMAYRSGASIVSKEFMYGGPRLRSDIEKQGETCVAHSKKDIIDTSYRYPFAITGGFTGWYNRPDLNAEGRPVVHPAWEAHCGRAPLYLNMDSFSRETLEWLHEYFERIELGKVQAEKIGLDIFRGGKIKWPASRIMTNSIFAGSGIWPINGSCAAAIPGLYSAGNSCGTMASGATYSGGGFGSNHAMVTGTRAGLGAAEYVLKVREIKIDQEKIKIATNRVCAPINRLGGFSPDWVLQALHGVTVPYYFLDVKHEKRLSAGLTIVEFINNHLVPKLIANDAHQWRQAHEIRNLVLITEMRLRASLFRKESRGNHFREDYPRRNDPTWLAWVKIRNRGGEMYLEKEPIPKEWWPDLSEPYEKRYPTILPLEEI